MTLPAGGNWEGGRTIDGRRQYHEPWVGWRDGGPTGAHGRWIAPPEDEEAIRTSMVSPAAGRRIHYGGRYPARRHRAARWARENRGHVVAITAALVVLGYTATVALFFDRAMPTRGSAAALVTAGAVLVGALLSVVLWARRE